MTLFPPCEADGETILRRADRAMYQAKAEWRNICLAKNEHEDMLRFPRADGGQ